VLCRCLLAKTYNAGAPLVDADLTEIARTAMSPQDVLLYCYYGGMLAAGAAGSESAPEQQGTHGVRLLTDIPAGWV
jgi:hypothetical protein